MWHNIVLGFSWLIQHAYELTIALHIPNYGLAIILMTIVIKMALFPLTYTQMRSMRGLQELQPQLKDLQAKHKDDPAKIQSEMMRFYKENKVNPLSGCLPLLVQMPILIAFYQAMYGFHYTNTAHAGFLLISNLSNLGPQEGVYGLILPLLSAVTTYYQQKISTVDTNDPTQKSMLLVMPLFLGWIAYKFPAGVALYWVCSNLLGIIQQLWINRSFRSHRFQELPVKTSN